MNRREFLSQIYTNAKNRLWKELAITARSYNPICSYYNFYERSGAFGVGVMGWKINIYSRNNAEMREWFLNQRNWPESLPLPQQARGTKNIDKGNIIEFCFERRDVNNWSGRLVQRVVDQIVVLMKFLKDQGVLNKA